MVVWLLFAIGLTTTDPQVGFRVFQTKQECQAAQKQVTDQAVKAGILKGSVSCYQVNIGDFS